MSNKGAYGTRAGDTDFRKKWDKEEYAKKARERDEEEKQHMQENEELMAQGKKPKKRRKVDLPKPTELMKRREGSLELEKNLGKTVVVQSAGNRGPGVPGFYCETCNRTYKDSAGYLDHINGRAHLRALGQTTKIERSTVEQVRARIAFLRDKTREASNAKSFDFEKRLAEVREREAALRAEKKAAKKAQREHTRIELAKNALARPEDEDGAVPEAQQDENGMMAMMGFAGFGTSKK